MNRTPMSQSYVNSQAGSSIGQDQQQQQQQQQQASNSDNNNNNNNNNSNNNNNNNNNNGINSNNNGQQQQTMNMMIGSSGEQMSQMTSLLLEFAFSAFVNKPHDIVEYAAQYFDQLRSQRGSTGAASQVHQQQQRSDSLGGPGGGGTKRASSDSQRSNLSQNSFTNEAGGAGYQTTNSYGQASEDEFEAYDQGPTELGNSQQQQQQQQLTNHDQSSAGGTTTGAGPPVFKPKTSYNRRKSVFAEAYDPAADQEDDENNRIVHGKTDEQRQRLAKAIKSIFLFRSVDPQDMTQILDAMFEVKVSPGDVVIRQGDDGDNFYVVERGKFQIYYTTDDGQRQVRGEYEDNGFFGELALMYNQPRAATVVAMSSGSLWAMDRKTFRRIVLKSAFKKRKEYEALFEKVGVLQCLNGYERMNLCDALESKRFLNGQMIIVQGDQANGMYFIESGNVKIVKQMDDGRVIDVAILGKGDYFGELALINHKPRAASVYAMGDNVKLAFLDVKAFERLLGSCIERMEKNCAMYLSELAHQEGRQNV